MKTLLALLLMAWVAAPLVSNAQEPVGQPHLRVGDQWITRKTDLWTGQEVKRVRAEVASGNELEATVVHTEIPLAGRVAAAEKRSTLNVRTLSFDNRETNLGEASLDLAFPLTVGKTWTTEFKTPSPNPNYQIPHTRTARVAAWESVTTPAGSFQAMRIEYVDRIMLFIADGIFPAHINTTVWYAPAVKWYVKRHEVLRNPLKKIETQTLEELVESTLVRTN